MRFTGGRGRTQVEDAIVAANRALVLLTLLVAGCMGTVSPSTSVPTKPVGTPAAIPEQSPAVTPTPPPLPTPAATSVCGDVVATGPFEPDSIVCVLEGPLHIGPRPDVTDDELAFEPLQAGQLLFVLDGPVAGTESSWYLVEKTPGGVVRADGWVPAAAPDGTPWLVPASVPCPSGPSLVQLAAMDVMQRVHCYHSKEFTFTDTVIAGPNCGDGVVLESPAWMASCQSTFWWGDEPLSLVLAVPPELAAKVGEVELPDGRFEATVTAHMDDQVAQTCVAHEGIEGDQALLRAGTVLACRGTFVATSIERLSP